MEEKQQIINGLHGTVTKKTDRIKELEDELYQNRVDKHAFKTFEHQNVLLLEELKDSKRRMEELEVEVRFLREMKQDKLDYDDEKIRMVAEMDIMLNGFRYEYPANDSALSSYK